MRTLCALFLALLCIATGSAQDYFPMQVGNLWMYQGTTNLFVNWADQLLITIPGTKEFDGVTYFVMRERLLSLNGEYTFPPFDRYLREDDSGNLLRYDPLTRTERGLYLLNASNASPNIHVEGPLGSFDNALRFGFAPGQTGLTAEYFLPYVGMVRRSMNTGGTGYTNYNLVYTQLNGKTLFTAPQVGFALSIDRATYSSGDTLAATLTLRNSETLPLQYAGTQLYDLVIRDSAGAVLYRWSEAQTFYGFVTFPPGTGAIAFIPGERNAVIAVPLRDGRGLAFPAGDYTAEAYLTTTNPTRYRAMVGFTIR